MLDFITVQSGSVGMPGFVHKNIQSLVPDPKTVIIPTFPVDFPEAPVPGRRSSAGSV